MDPKTIVVLMFQLSIICMVLGFGLHAKRGDLLYLWRRPGLLLRSVLSVLVVMPIVAVTMERFFDFHRAAELAIVALSLSPIPPLLPTKTDRAGGGHAYIVALLLALSLIAIVVVPASTALLGWIFHREVQMSIGAVAKVVLLMIVAPLLVGKFLRRRWPAGAAKLAPIVAMIAKVLLPLAVIALLAAAWRGIWDAIGDGSVLAIVAFVLIGLAVGHFLGRPDRGHSTVLGLATACRHPAIALTIASANYPHMQFVGTILLYVLVSAIVCVPYVMFMHRCEVEQKPAS
jgi:BASS family bile acid:Na+ symporter